MENEKFELAIVNHVINICNYVDLKKKKFIPEISKILSFNLAILDYDSEMSFLDSPNYFFDLMSMCLSGKIIFDKEVFNFNDIIQNNINDQIIKIYLMSSALLIYLEYKEFKNFYKAIVDQFNNRNFILGNVKKAFENLEIQEVYFDPKIYKCLVNEASAFYEIILGSGILLK